VLTDLREGKSYPFTINEEFFGVTESISAISRTTGGHLGLAAILNFSKDGHNSFKSEPIWLKLQNGSRDS